MSRNSAKPGKEFWLGALRHDGGLIDEVTSPEILDEPLPCRPGLTVADALGALGAEYRWVCQHVARGLDTPPDLVTPDPPKGLPVIAWWHESYRHLLDFLDETDADHPAWNWAPQPKRAGFWHRRMAHLTALDRWDIQLAAGTTEPLEAKTASDGVSELFDTLLTASRGGRRHEPAGVVRLIAADTGYEWFVRLRDPGLTLLDVTPHDAPPVQAVAAGTASDLLLALTGRVGFDLVNTAGDLRLLTQLVPRDGVVTGI
ncbi:MAG: maleylpyruvate isomerase N-terminal domain-containing protein [Actinocatenispora sp.]